MARPQCAARSGALPSETGGSYPLAMLINRGWTGRIGVFVALAAGCGDSGGGTASMSNSESQTGTSTTGAATEPTGEDSGSASNSQTEGNEGGNSDSLSGTTGDEGGNSDSVSASGGSGNETVSGSGTTSGETGNVSGGGETSASTGEVQTTGEPPIDCAEIVDEQACVAAMCKAVKGRQIKDDDAIACIEDVAVFLGCLPNTGCDDVITTVCKGDAQYQLPDSCFPDGFATCDPPPDVGGDGYPSCP
jgi:hypothetical protein